MDDDIEEFMVRFPPDFPLNAVIEIADELMADGGIVPGFVLADRGVFDVMAIEYSKLMGEMTLILPDRNLISRIAAIAEGRARYPLDAPAQLAANLMAFCQCMNLNFEPVVAFHELAHKEGNDEANRELAWFRAADQPQALAWVAVSRGTAQGLGDLRPAAITDHDFARALPRWERNYVVALKIAELELSERQPLDRAVTLLDWMIDHFFLAGPAAVFASMYFSPNAAKKRLHQAAAFGRSRAGDRWYQERRVGHDATERPDPSHAARRRPQGASRVRDGRPRTRRDREAAFDRCGGRGPRGRAGAAHVDLVAEPKRRRSR